jgi:hypothetical protein
VGETGMIRVPDDVRARFTGSLLAPGEEGYDAARRVHNGLIDRRPALVARCHTTADVVEAVNLGRQQASEISIRGGGHNVAGRSVTEGGLMIDLAPMKGIRVDPRTWRVWAQPGVTWAEYNQAAALHGLATTGGVVSSTGIAGLTLGGGEGWLMGRYGLTVDNVLSAELVTADGEVLTASAEENADLFWALRGGGGNFGVVTAFEYRAHPVSTVTGGAVVHSLRDRLAVLDFYREFTNTVPDDLTVFLGLGDPGDGSGDKLVGMSLCHCGGDLDQVDSDLAPLRKFGSPMVDDVRLMPYPVINTLSDGGYPRGALNYWKSAFVRELSGEVMGIMADAFERCPSPLGGFGMSHYHGAATRVEATATAFPHREPGYSLLVVAQWLDPSETERNIAWAKETFSALGPHLDDRRYVNNLSDHDPASVAHAYGANYDRLVEVKRRYDPENVFRLNHNINPEG